MATDSGLDAGAAGFHGDLARSVAAVELLHQLGDLEDRVRARPTPPNEILRRVIAADEGADSILAPDEQARLGRALELVVLSASGGPDWDGIQAVLDALDGVEDDSTAA